MYRFIFVYFLLFISYAYAAVENTPIKSNVELEPGQSQTVTIETKVPEEIGWQTIQDVKCAMNCVEATDRSDTSGMYESSFATSLGGSMKYTPVKGKIIIEYKNKSDQEVMINIYQVKRTCEAEACAFIDANEKGRWLVFKIDQFSSIETSKDNSYSTISGVTTSGKPFTVKAVWWTDSNKFIPMANCSKFIKRYLDEGTPKDKYSPYILSGSAVGDKGIVLKDIDDCAPSAPHFGVPEKNVYQ